MVRHPADGLNIRAADLESDAESAPTTVYAMLFDYLYTQPTYIYVLEI